MPNMYTNTSKKPVQSSSQNPADHCVSSYNEYATQRVSEKVEFTALQKLTDAFKGRISSPLRVLNPDLEMGEYFVIPVNEIRELLNSDKNIEFVHICNALRETVNSNGTAKTFPVTILVPVTKTSIDGQNQFVVCQNDEATYVEAYPCPPDPACPKRSELIGTILKLGTDINSFNSLF